MQVVLDSAGVYVSTCRRSRHCLANCRPPRSPLRDSVIVNGFGCIDLALLASASSIVLSRGIVQPHDPVFCHLHRKVRVHLDSLDGWLCVLTRPGVAGWLPFQRGTNWMTVHEQLRDWLVEAADAAVQFANRSEIEEGAQKLRSAIEVAAGIPFESQVLPALRNLHRVSDTPRARGFAALAPSLQWVQSHRWDDEGNKRALCVLSDAFELPGLEVGIMYVDQNCSYPIHNHPPQELYLTISGSARWRYGGSEKLIEVEPETTLYNHPSDIHTVEAGDTPLVAMYVLWGQGLRP